MHFNNVILRVSKYKIVNIRLYSQQKEGTELLNKFYDFKIKKRASHAVKMRAFFKLSEDLSDVKQYIPEKYLQLKKNTTPENLYLVCPQVAKRIVKHILPSIKKNKNQIVSETSPGPGLIAKELLENGIQNVRLYESCPEFRDVLMMEFNTKYPGRAELFSKNIFHLHRASFLDKQDHGNRVVSLLKNVPTKSWTDDPVMTVVGAMPKTWFLKYLIKCLYMQNDIANHGRVQVFAILNPKDYAIMTSGPEHNLHTYKAFSILCSLLFVLQFLENLPRKVFVPWENAKRTTVECNKDEFNKSLYLVKINFRKHLPLPVEELLPFVYFLLTFSTKGHNRIIPTIEKWVPGSGLNILQPTLNHKNNYFKNMSIFTEFRELNPIQTLAVFKEMINHESYKSSPFLEMVENILLKTETIESSVDDANMSNLERTIIEDLEIKMNVK